MFNFSFEYIKGSIINGASYCEADFGFYFEGNLKNNYQNIFMISLDPLEIYVDFEKHHIIHVSGYCPYNVWNIGLIPDFADITGTVKVLSVQPVQEFVAYRIEKKEWSFIFDIEKRMFFAGNFTSLSNGKFIKINYNQWIILSDSAIIGILMRPLEVDNFLNSLRK